MNNKWFKEDRALPKPEQAEAIERSKQALQNSTLMSRRLTNILKDMIEVALRDDEDFVSDNWQVRAIANASRRKTLKEVINLLPTKELDHE